MVHPLKVSLLAIAAGILTGVTPACGKELVDVLFTPERGLSQPTSKGFEGVVDPRTREIILPRPNLERR